MFYSENDPHLTHLVELGRQVRSKLHHQVPPDLHLGEEQRFGPHVDGQERLQQQLHALGAAQDLWKDGRSALVNPSSAAEPSPPPPPPSSPGFRAKLSMRLFQAMKAIFLTVGEELRKPSSSRCSRELMKGPPLCSSCAERREHLDQCSADKRPSDVSAGAFSLIEML